MKAKFVCVSLPFPRDCRPTLAVPAHIPAIRVSNVSGASKVGASAAGAHSSAKSPLPGYIPVLLQQRGDPLGRRLLH